MRGTVTSSQMALNICFPSFEEWEIFLSFFFGVGVVVFFKVLCMKVTIMFITDV